MDNSIECGVNFLSFDRALNLVPPEFIPAYKWFLSMENQEIPRLPRGVDAPPLSVPITLAAQRGMHSPDYRRLPSKGSGKKKYILSAHSSGGSQSAASRESVSYDAAEAVWHPDGTWTIDYPCQIAKDGKKRTDRSNEYMMNNLTDGVPVAFMAKTEDANGYRIFGLAYVEAFNPLTRMFTLHGPVSAEAEGINFYSWITNQDLSEKEMAILRAADELNGEAFVAVQVMRRRHQNEFRKAVMTAYDSKCAATGIGTPNVLQAAHIDPFARSQSHAVTNGILLRADVHLLYDAHLLTIRPDTGRIVVSDAVKDPSYRILNGEYIRYPKIRECRPDQELLQIHFDSYNSCQRVLGLSCA